MMRVTDTQAGKKIGAWLIFDQKGNKVGQIHAHYGNSTTVNVWSWTDRDNPQYAEAKASGYGYDKFTAALVRTGIKFGDHPIYDHCHTNELTKKALAAMQKHWPSMTQEAQRQFQERWAKKGVEFANYRDGVYTSAYMKSGLRGLDYRGYRVEQAI